MRRSAAPSLKQGATSSSILTENHKVQQDTFSKAPRSTASILKLLCENNKDNQEETSSVIVNNPKTIQNLQPKPAQKSSIDSPKLVGGNINIDSASPISSTCRIFNVVWGKPSTKKHKTWEGDGTLEVREKGVTLKDTEGKVLGNASRKKSETLEEGSRLFVGNKEIEIIDLASEGPSTTNETVCEKRSADYSTYKRHHPPKKAKTQTGFSVPVRSPLGPGFLGQYEPLQMPQPPHEHQWKSNTSCLPITDVAVDPFLTRVLRPHQREGVVFLYKSIMGFHKLQFQGAILADEMGLGKTLQCITLIWTLLKKGPYGSHPVLRKVLVVTPSSLVKNWQKEFVSWLGRERISIFTVDQKNKPKDYKKSQREPVLLISYEMFLRCFEDISAVNFDLLICDEGHRLKNSSIKISTLLSKLDCPRKILLTGTPFQNDLQEFYALIHFVNPGILDTSSEFHQYFEQPLIASRQPNASEETKKLGEARASELYNQTKWFILRRTQEVINRFLPTKQESVVFCKMSQVQEEYYRTAVLYWENRDESFFTENIAHLSVITSLKKICNHPALALDKTCQDETENITTHLIQNFQNTCDFSVSCSGKLSVLFTLLQHISQTNERMVIVSYFTQTLDLIATVCKRENYTYCRLDGSTPLGQRQNIVDQFNNSYSTCFIFLLSARAGGVGLNLTGASRLVLYDSDWNPASDLQAMSRIWRDGQKKAVHIYRLLTTGSIEEKIYQRQLNKTALADGIVDAQNISNIKLSTEELKDLFRIHEGINCLTHDLLRCKCDGIGEAPGSPESFEEDNGEYCDNECSLFKARQPTKSRKLQMNELFNWEHHSYPLNIAVLEAMGLHQASDIITYIFRNISVMKRATSSC